MIRIGVIVLVVAMLVAAPLPAAAQGTPEATPAEECAFPPITIELLREIRDVVATNPPPTPTTAADGYSSSRTHLIQFPPPAGEPIDAATAESIRRFLDDYGECIGSGDILAVYGAWTEPHLRRGFGANLERIEAIIEALEAGLPILGYPSLDFLLLRAWRIESGHTVVVAQMEFDPQPYTFLLLPAGDSWRIDDQWNVSPRMLEGSLTGPTYATPIADD